MRVNFLGSYLPYFIRGNSGRLSSKISVFLKRLLGLLKSTSVFVILFKRFTYHIVFVFLISHVSFLRRCFLCYIYVFLT